MKKRLVHFQADSGQYPKIIFQVPIPPLVMNIQAIFQQQWPMGQPRPSQMQCLLGGGSRRIIQHQYCKTSHMNSEPLAAKFASIFLKSAKMQKQSIANQVHSRRNLIVLHIGASIKLEILINYKVEYSLDILKWHGKFISKF